MYTKAAIIGCFLFLLPFSYVAADVSHLSGGSVQQNWNIRNNIPGEPDVDYPIYSVPPTSSFSCRGRHYGYYADVESRCQVFRVCAQTDLTGKGFAFLCPNGTLFNQKFFVCDWYKNVDCSASESFYARNNMFGTDMGSMSKTVMMSMVHVMMDYTKQPQFNNQNVNNNGGFPFTNSQFPKHSDNAQSFINHNNGLSSGNGNFNGQPSVANQGRSSSNVQSPERGSDVLSQPIFPTENSRLTTPSHTQGTSSSAASTSVPDSTRLSQNANFNSNTFDGANNYNNNQQPTLFVSSLGEISSDQNLRFNPFTTAIVSTRTFDTLSSNVDPVSTTADQVQKFALHGQYNQLNGNTQSNVPYNAGNGLNNPVSLQQEINHLSVSGSNEPNLSQQLQSRPSNSVEKSNAASNDQSDPTLTAVYSGSGDLLSHTIGQYSKATNAPGPSQNFANGRDPGLSVLVNSLGETLYTPVFSGEGNLLSQTIGQKASFGNEKQDVPVSTPQPRLQTPLFDGHSRITISPYSTGSTGSSVQDNVPTTNVAYSGQGSLSSQTVTQSSQSSNSYSAGNKLLNQQKNTQTPPRNQGTSSGSQVTSVPSTSSYGQKLTGTSKQVSASTNVQSNRVTPSHQATTYNSNASFGQKLSTSSTTISTTAAPYSPSVPPFRSTTATVYTPTATSYNQRTQSYNDQSHKSRSYTQQSNGQSAFSKNQFQVLSKEYLPSTDNTRTARTNGLAFGNYGSSTLKLSSSQNNLNQRDSRQQFTYPVDQTDSKILDNTNDLPNLGADADPKKQNLINRDVTHIDKYLYQNQIEQPKNETGEPTVTTHERNSGIQLSEISIKDIFYLNNILQEGGRLEDITSEETQLPSDEQNVTEPIGSELIDFKRSPIVVAPISDGASNDIEDNEVLRKFDRAANLLFAGLQLSLHEERELSESEIKNELNDEIFQSQDIYETKIRNPKDVYSSGGGLKQANSIKLIFERAKNRSNDFRIKLKSRTEEENKAKRTYALMPSTAEEKLVTILKPLLKNITVTPNRYLDNNTKIGGFINNDLKSLIGEPRQKHSLAPRILFKNVKTIEDIERIATGIDTDDDELTSETKLSNRVAFPDNSFRSQTTTKIDSKTTNSSIEPSLEVVAKDKDWSYYTKTKLFPQRNLPRPIRDHETAASNQHSYTYSSGQAHQASPQTYSTYNQYNSYPQQQQQQQPQYQQQQPQYQQQQQPQHSIHYATIDNRPNPSQTSVQAPPLQSNYPVSIQNNPQTQSSYHSIDNRYVPAAPLPIPSSIPPFLPSIVHPTSQYSTQQISSFATNQHDIPKTTSNDKVVVNVIPATGWYLNDPNERQSFLDAVSRGLLSEKGFVYVNDVQSSQRQQPNFNTQQPQGRSQTDIDEEAFFRGSSSYESPLNSVGKLSGDSDSVSAYLDGSTSSPLTAPSSSSSSSSSSGYQYEHPRRSFDV